MQLPEAIKLRIEKILNENNITSYSLAIKAGIPTSTLNDFLRGKANLPRIDTLLHLCEAVNIELKDFFDDPLFKDVEFDKNE